MKLKFFGAAGIVTGSCHMLKFNNKKILVDCGMFQGRKQTSMLNYEPFKFDPKEIDAVFLTHAHIDHSGLIPKLYKHGYRNKIYCTAATKDLCRIMLEDSAGIQEFENKWDNKRLKKQGKPLRQPLYSVADAKKCMKLFKGIQYNELIKVFDDLEVVFRDAGHIMGSAIVEAFVLEDKPKKIIFSGDLGQWNAPIIDDPTCLKTADFVVCESTYGGRTHEPMKKRDQILIDLIKTTYKNGGKLLIPSFAIERTQELIYTLNRIAEKNLIPKIPIFVDSPLAIKATKIFQQHTENYDDEAVNLLAEGDNPFEFPNLTYTLKTEESKALNEMAEPAVIIASSGMCTGGRIKHHLKNHMGKPNTTIFFIGFQAQGTLGRRIRDGTKFVKIYGKSYKINAKIVDVEGFSSHADQPQLMKWLNCFQTKPKLFIVHGEPDEQAALKKAYKSGHIAKLWEEVEL
ncbi:MBL fold metallo-hydrolase [Candidatus Woesearchaeota archaeon]|jgi:metallo-beta-lactamase family protein|nr:MBL fold metallo-hydrolase [Candidatus Woesearchaeota archaeon]MBT4368896.1 MBL fold metallo-hydrolase [Candidatus Woesearchaeota archaeon]MBT4712185.1 MBL fold metallo-hydrolase [Candidatus Woesearchaeota archaeon]MBT6639067.1 MBL fold metallo-hydrolase [Candidatus Woesearchaeota archaeon]MBT7134267.1 MBL fold metallo-hydrolase [Candidatus Woesearchaeota archaeon]